MNTNFWDFVPAKKCNRPFKNYHDITDLFDCDLFDESENEEVTEEVPAPNQVTLPGMVNFTPSHETPEGDDNPVIQLTDSTDDKVASEIPTLSFETTSEQSQLPSSLMFHKMLCSPQLFPVLGQLAKLMNVTGEKEEKRKLAQDLILNAYLSARQNVGDESTHESGFSFKIEEYGNAVLTRDSEEECGWKLKLRFFNRPCAEKAIEMPYAPEDYLTERGFEVVGSGAVPPTLLLELSAQVKDFSATALGNDFFRFLRKRISCEKSSPVTIRYTYDGESPAEEKNVLFEILHTFKRYGLIKNLNCDRLKNTVYCAIPNECKCSQFLTGSWLELALYTTVEQVVKEMGAKLKLPVCIKNNVKIKNRIEQKTSSYELDVCFTIGKQLFVCEAKTGSADYDRLATVGKDLAIIPDALLLVNSDLTPDEAEVISYLYPFHIISATGIDTELRTMITDCLRTAGQISSNTPAAA